MTTPYHPSLSISVEVRDRAPSNVLIDDPLSSMAALVTLAVPQLDRPADSSRLVVFCMDESHRKSMLALTDEPDLDIKLTPLATQLISADHCATIVLDDANDGASRGLVLLHRPIRPSVEEVAAVIATHLSRLNAMLAACPGCHAHLPFHPAVVEAAVCSINWLYGDNT